jgi:hypothetical protein
VQGLTCRLEGKVIYTNNRAADMTTGEAVQIYKDLFRLERAFI